MGYRICVDTGGTFTDLALSDGEQVVGIFKSPTTPDDIFQGILNALQLAADDIGVPLGTLLAQSDELVYATTLSTNVILQGRLRPPAFLTTRGHRDILLYREGGKPEPYNLRIPFPKPFVPRHLTFEVTERILADGSVYMPLDEKEVVEIAARLRELGVETVAICFLWSIAEPKHELRAREILLELLPQLDVTLSHELNPIMREYRRASSTCINAALRPLMREHLQRMDARLRELGFTGEPLMVTHTSGGMLPFAQIADHPIHTIDSGPAMAPIAGRTYAMTETSSRDVIVIDAGGTSFDVSLIRNLLMSHTQAKWLGREWLGHMTGMSAVDTRSIGAGGGSIAWVDPAGLLHVGPQSAGAVPGPACYRRGGNNATVTDCALVLGYIDADFFLGGRIVLDIDRAREVIERDVAHPLGLTVQAAAEGVITVAGEAMTNLIREITVNQGLDPRECLIVGGGGAGGLNIVSIAQELECPEVLIPGFAAGLSAVGGLFSDLVTERSLGFFVRSDDFDVEGVNRVLKRLTEELADFFGWARGGGAEVRSFSVDARYANQAWELEVPLGEMGCIDGEEGARQLKEAFHARHHQTFGVSDPNEVVECINWRARGWKVLRKPRFREVAGRSQEPVGRRVYMAGIEQHATVYLPGSLEPGTWMEGPAIVEEPTTTIVVPKGAGLQITPYGNYRIAVHLRDARAVDRDQ